MISYLVRLHQAPETMKEIRKAKERPTHSGLPPISPSATTTVPSPGSAIRSEDPQRGSAKSSILVFRNLLRFDLNAFTDCASTHC